MKDQIKNMILDQLILLVQVVFLALKLDGIIDCSWFIVFIPVEAAVLLSIFGLALYKIKVYPG